MTQLFESIKKLAVIAAVLIAVPMITRAQQPLPPREAVKHGQEIFANNCTFCHGEMGSGGSAPRVASRGFDGQYIDKMVTYGVPGTAMPPWGQRLIAQDLNAVIAYVKSLNGVIVADPPAPPVLSGEAARGRDLFFDVTKELGSCSNCHALMDKGVSVAPPIKHVPSASSELGSLATSQLKNATVDGDTFPAIVVIQRRDETKLYDLTTVPPALRTFTSSSVKLKDGATWQHSSVIGAYSSGELDSILAFLRATVRP